MRDMKDKIVAEILVKEFINRMGVHVIIHSHQGKNFESKLFQQMCGMFRIKKTRTIDF